MKLYSNSIKDTLKIGKLIAANVKKGDIICLSGTLGSGKTMLTKGIAEGLKISGKDVISPSFVLLREYTSGELPLYHFDLYRLSGPNDIVGLGYEEYLFAQGLSVIEWAERLKYLKPEEFLGVTLFVKGDAKRELVFKARGNRHKELLRKINEDISA